MKKLISVFLCVLWCSSILMAQEAPMARVPYNNNLKITILSIFSGSLKLTYERRTCANQSVEITAGVIVPALDILKHSNPKGGLARLAYKFIFPVKQQLPLEGFYIKPELAFSGYSYYNNDMECRFQVYKMALMAVGGYQWVRSRFVFDVFLGLGGCVGNPYYSNYHHGFLTFNTKSVVAYTSGFKVGVAF